MPVFMSSTSSLRGQGVYIPASAVSAQIAAHSAFEEAGVQAPWTIPPAKCSNKALLELLLAAFKVSLVNGTWKISNQQHEADGSAPTEA